VIPLRDNVPGVHKPVALYVIMALTALAFLYQLGLTPRDNFWLAVTYGVVPARYFVHPAGAWTGHVLTEILPFFTYMFLHGGWLHLLMNMWVLWIFGDNVEDVMGPGRFALFYVLCGLAALAAQMFFSRTSMVPIIGASGAIAGVMGAYLLLYPHARVIVLIPIIFIPYFIELPAVFFLTLWFALQFVSGWLSTSAATEGGVAFFAHAGGFIAGLVLMPFLRRKDRCYHCYDWKRRRYEFDSTGRDWPFPPGSTDRT